MRNNFDLLLHGQIAQIERLNDEKNKAKGDFETDIVKIYNGILEEFEELRNEFIEEADLYTGNMMQVMPIDKVNRIRLREEAADLANYCHMLIAECDRQIKENAK